MARSVRNLTARLAVILMGAGLAISGLVLLLRAGWVAMALPLGPIWASVILGAVLLLIGAGSIALAMRRKRQPPRADPELIVLVTNAFLQGLAAGRASGRQRGQN